LRVATFTVQLTVIDVAVTVVFGLLIASTGITEMVKLPDLVGSSVLVAVTVTFPAVVAEKMPELAMLPEEADQFTFEEKLPVPVTVGTQLVVLPAIIDVTGQTTVTAVIEAGGARVKV
jgi:hypothetical protein